MSLYSRRRPYTRGLHRRRRRRVRRAVRASRDEAVTALANVHEEGLRGIQHGLLPPNRTQPLVDHRTALGLTTVQNATDLGQAQPRCLTGPHDAAAHEMLLVVLAVPRRGSSWHDDTFVLPMPQDVRRHVELGGRFADPHRTPP